MSARTATPAPTGTAVVAPAEANPALPTAIAVTRIIMGFYFLWAFLDKTLGLGFATPAERAWVAGGSPTTGFLTNATAESPLANLFAAIAGNPLVDWLFMLGLLGVGVTLIFGVGVRLGAIAGVAMLALMYLAEFPLTLTGATNPLIDSHIIDMGIMAIVFFAVADQRLSLAPIWRRIVGHRTWLW
jgi:thiosulfate dehydrogenase [quinone] large subunit